MNRTKVTVACKACQKKKVKCTGISPCTNCIKAGHRCEFTGTAKKRGPRNGNVEVIKSPARRIENVLQENPNLRDQIQQMLAHSTRPSVRSARPSSVIPPDAPIVIIDDDTGVTTDASQSHGIPRPSISSAQDRHGHAAINLGAYSRDGFSNKPQINHKQLQTPILRKPIPTYPVNMRNHVTDAPAPTSPHLDLPVSLPPISELGAPSQRDVKPKCLLPQISSSNRITLPVPNCTTRKKALSMPIVNLSSGIEVLLPPAPDLTNPFDSLAMSSNKNQNSSQNPILLPPPLSPSNKKYDTSPFSSFSSLPSPPSSQFFASPKPTPPGLYDTAFGKSQSRNPPTPTDSSPPLSPRNVFPNSDGITNSPTSQWKYDNNFGTFGTFSFSQRGDEMEIDRLEIIF